MERVAPFVTQHDPPPDLAPFVHRFMHGVSAQPGELRIPPTGGIFVSYVCGSPLTVHFDDWIYAKKPRLFLGGQLRHERPVLRSEGRFELVGAELTPTGYYKLFHRHANLLTDSIADLLETDLEAATILAGSVPENADRECVIAGLAEGFRALAANAAKAPLVEAVVDEISRCNGIVKLGRVYRNHPVAPRQMRRYFEQVVGISPKHFAKICQVNVVIKAMMQNDSERLRSLALDHGFYDQAHFIHDFRRFVAMDPGEFLRGGSQFLRTYLGKAWRPAGRAE
ncbi:MAG TPA: helix-turn-helix domain-containing protein [Wenzhouxiangellaceae bacterium]|nr:helix-turn-helix domain-containing protein [Wenzhouxiangellaceae bacterium]